MIRNGSILAALLLVSACSTPASGLKSAEKPPVTPTQHYKMEAEEAPEQIALGQHAEGLSDHQRAALTDYARGYIEAGAEKVTIRSPAGGGATASRMAEAARAALEQAGLSDREVALDVYQADKPDAPIVLAYDHWRAKPIECGRHWTDLTATRDNQAQANFGCAETANMAAQVADPHDIKAPRASDASDAGRRATVLEKYRKGEVTSSADDARMKTAISQAVQ